MTKQLTISIAVAVLCTALVVANDVPEDRGAMGLSQALNRLDVVGSVLHTGAHPDDENSSLLAWLSRGQGVRMAYLSATRGDGGQNLLGTELFEALGVIRTEELLAARRADHGQQFFTPNFEFGFSKSADETLEKWGRERVLGDFVRVIRHFRPEIIISRFTGTARDGHGHHQVAGIITKEAFRAAADPSRFPEYGKPWQARKLYLNSMGENQEQGLTVNVGEFNQALGRSYHEIAMEGRSLHRSQSMGALREKGPRNTTLQLIDRADGIPADGGLFSGTTHKLVDLAKLEPALAPELGDLSKRIDAIRAKAGIARAGELVPELAEALRVFNGLRQKAANAHVQFLLQGKDADFHEAIRLASGLVIEAIASDDTVVPGQEFDLSFVMVNGGPHDFPGKLTWELPRGWEARVDEKQGPVAEVVRAGQRLQIKYKVKVAADAAFSQPYWLREPRQADRFTWPTGAAAMMPFDAPLIHAALASEFRGVPLKLSTAAEYRRVDNIYGEQRWPVSVLPALSVQVSPDIAIVPISGKREKTVTVAVENQSVDPGEAEVSLTVPPGWSYVPQVQTVRFQRQGEKSAVQFLVSVPAVEGDFKVGATARQRGREYRSGYTLVSYLHIDPHYLFAPAESKVEVFDVRTTVQHVGYVEGAGDRVADYLRQLGVNVTLLTSQDLASGDLSRFQTIVLGVRAYAVREDLRANNGRLMEYVKNGGTLFTQYNTYEILDSQFGPYPFSIKRPHDRVTREEAKVTILDPRHPVINGPNRISDKDFEGWVQERGLYFLGTWDPQYTPILESHDPGEDPQRGGLVVAKYGNGMYIYSGYGFFRQLPAGVKGAYRLFANLVSLVNQ